MESERPEFEWDELKAASNLRKHGVAFEDAIAVFEDDDAVTVSANTVGEEQRFKRTGRADASALLTVVYTLRIDREEVLVRVISARAASRRERRIYGDRSI